MRGSSICLPALSGIAEKRIKMQLKYTQTILRTKEVVGERQSSQATKVALLTNLKRSSAIRSYKRSLQVRDAWVASMVLRPAWG